MNMRSDKEEGAHKIKRGAAGCKVYENFRVHLQRDSSGKAGAAALESYFTEING